MTSLELFDFYGDYTYVTRFPHTNTTSVVFLIFSLFAPLLLNAAIYIILDNINGLGYTFKKSITFSIELYFSHFTYYYNYEDDEPDWNHN